MTFHRTTAVLLAAAALGVPATASARSATEPPAAEHASVVQADMHASVAMAAAASRGGQGQDLRSPDARDAAVPVVQSQDLRSPDARDAALERPGGGAPAPSQTAWPSTAWSVPSPQPAAAAAADDGIEWSTLLLGIGGALLLAGGLAFTATRGSRRRVAV